MRYYTITSADVGQFTIRAFGQTWPVSDFLGRVLPQDVGKRVYLRPTVLQVESSPQRAARLTARPEPACECTDTCCPQTVADTGHHPAGGRPPTVGCGQPAVMHLFRVAIMVHETPVTEKGPVDFCEPCGDNALQSGAFATGEDVAAARRDPDAAGNSPFGLLHFSATWATLLSQIDLHVVHHAVNVVLMAHDETCIECHNVDQRARCPLRLSLIAVMTQERGGQ